MPIYDYRIAQGHNVALGSLTNIEAIKPTDDVYFYPPRAWGTYRKGEPRAQGDGSIFFTGYPSLTWFFGKMTRRQFEYLNDTYCGGNYSGTVTIYTRTDDPDAYVRLNATMVLTPLADSETNFTVQQNYAVQMTRLEEPT